MMQISYKTDHKLVELRPFLCIQANTVNGEYFVVKIVSNSLYAKIKHVKMYAQC